MEEKPKANWLAIVSLVLGLLALVGVIGLMRAIQVGGGSWGAASRSGGNLWLFGFLLAYAGLICGIFAIIQIGKKGGNGRNSIFAIVGTAIGGGYGWLCMFLAFLPSATEDIITCLSCLIGDSFSQCFAAQGGLRFSHFAACNAYALFTIALLLGIALALAGVVLCGIWIRRLYGKKGREWHKRIAIPSLVLLAYLGWLASLLFFGLLFS